MHDARVDDLKAASIPDLLRELATETTTLVHQEIELAKVELGANIRDASRGALLFAAAAALGLGAFGALTAAFIAVVALAVPLWGAALVVTALYALAAASFAGAGRATLRQAAPITPQQTAQTVKEDVEWLKMRAQSNKK